MQIPVESSIVASTLDQQAQDRLEQEHLKRLVLQSEQRQNMEGAAVLQRKAIQQRVPARSIARHAD
jgi:hypothetical protein